MNIEIGGYFELECKTSNHYHNDAIKLNSARYCLEYILSKKNYKKIYIPFYTCDSVLKPVRLLDIEIEYYSIDKNFMPILDKRIKDYEVILFINYFGLNIDNILSIKNKYKNIIIDNTQAFYVKPQEGIDTLYSPRKFFGVSDGGYLYTDIKKDYKLKKDVSYKRYKYLLKRTDLGAQSGYEDFLNNEIELNNQEVLEMSNLTSAILSSLDYKDIKNKRELNFKLLHENLKDINELIINKSLMNNGPMVYPLLISKDGIREYLIENKIYVATYWKDVLKRVDKNSFEAHLTKYLLPLPIDQRYGEEEMQYIIKIIKKKLEEK